MSQTINLATGSQVTKTEAKKYFLGSIVFLVACLLIALIFIGVNYIYTQKYDQLVAKETELQSRIESQAAKRANLVLLHERLSTIQKIVDSRKDLNQKFVTVLSLVPNGVGISASELSNSLIAMEFKSNSLSSINDMLNGFYSLDSENSQMKNVKLNSFDIDKDSQQYRLEINFVF